MYFLTEEERKFLLRGILPRSREMGVAEELRGWQWHEPPLQPTHDVRLPVYEVAAKYCPSGRDLYLRRVLGVRVKPSKEMIMGSVLHQTIFRVMVRAKRLIYEKGADRYKEIINCLHEPLVGPDIPSATELKEDDLNDIRQKAGLISEFEATRLSSRIHDILARQPHIGEDSLAALAIPVVMEHRLDGSFLGLSQNLSADAYTFSEPMIVDVKFGPPEKFHHLTTTAYALVMEALYEFPINVGCLVYVQFRGDRIIVQKDFHTIDDENRQWFIEERDEKMRFITDELDPGFPQTCHQKCLYREHCNR
ncbi:MAG: type I-A CRISPR-associated protein Cas4/Csa1 [Firmicutes bacterium]|nr:type I-A CRISPR-associated protein Cas4/Csa1 [Bacillota bacterium]